MFKDRQADSIPIDLAAEGGRMCWKVEPALEASCEDQSTCLIHIAASRLFRSPTIVEAAGW